MPDLTPAMLKVLYEFHALRFRIKLLQLSLAVQKAGFNPNQPRVPAGSALGGQWVSSSGSVSVEELPEPTRPRSSARDGEVAPPFDEPGLYYVDLQEEDRKGGHGFSKHVGKSAGYLKAYMIAWNMNPENGTHPAEGSFHSLGEANNLVSAVLRAHPKIVGAAILGGTNLRITHRFGYDTGYEAYQPVPEIPPVIRTTYWVEVYITHDPRPNGRGYRVVTAYPMNDTPNEVPARKR